MNDSPAPQHGCGSTMVWSARTERWQCPNCDWTPQQYIRRHMRISECRRRHEAETARKAVRRAS